MKTIAKVLEVMLTKPATPTWTTSDAPLTTRGHGSSTQPALGPLSQWGWGGSQHDDVML